MKGNVMIRKFLYLISAILFCGCNFGFQKMEAGEYGVKFCALPGIFGGGVEKKVVQPGEMEFIFPWETVYRVNTTIQSIGWGAVGQGDNSKLEDYIETRAIDGNEVGLAVTVQYHVNPEMVTHIVQYVGLGNVRPLLAAVARADIRTHMNALSTAGFINPEERSKALDAVKKALNYRLNREGIIVDEVMYFGHRFERRLPGGQVIGTYQQIIDETQAKRQEVEREPKLRDAVAKQKEKEYYDTQADVNQIEEAAKGYELQAKVRGDNYLKERSNFSQQILATGLGEVEGLKKQVSALSGDGGKALLRLAIAKELAKSTSKFLLLNSNSTSIDVNRIDTNELMEQMGILAVGKEGLGENQKK